MSQRWNEHGDSTQRQFGPPKLESGVTSEIEPLDMGQNAPISSDSLNNKNRLSEEYVVYRPTMHRKATPGKRLPKAKNNHQFEQFVLKHPQLFMLLGLMSFIVGLILFNLGIAFIAIKLLFISLEVTAGVVGVPGFVLMVYTGVVVYREREKENTASCSFSCNNCENIKRRNFYEKNKRRSMHRKKLSQTQSNQKKIPIYHPAQSIPDSQSRSDHEAMNNVDVQPEQVKWERNNNSHPMNHNTMNQDPFSVRPISDIRSQVVFDSKADTGAESYIETEPDSITRTMTPTSQQQSQEQTFV